VANVTSTSGMFRSSGFNQDISGWTTSSVTNMSSMFRENNVFNQPIGSWDVSSVTNMNAMFFNQSPTTGFNQDLDLWNVSSVTNMSDMFYAARAFNGDITTWNTSSVTTMANMFNSNPSFNQDIGSWNISSLTNANAMLSGASAFSTSNYDALLIGWAAQAPNINTGVTLSGGPQYTSAAVSARNVLTSTYSWTIVDGGLA
jgi:surface protein